MTAIKIIDAAVKLNIAVEALKNPALKTKELADMFDVSERTVRRVKNEYAEAALKAFEEMKAKELEAVAASKSKGPKGWRPRNGRMSIIREVVDKMGVDAKTSDVYAEVNRISVERGVDPIIKTAFYVLVCEVRRDMRAGK